MRLSVGVGGAGGRLKAIPDGEVKHSRSAWHRFHSTVLRFKRIKSPWSSSGTEAKSEKNVRARKLDFAFAALIFDGPVLEKIDDRADYGETRIQAIGAAEGEILFVVYTYRGQLAASSRSDAPKQRSAPSGYRS
jgi:uncharacterized DUF497 family protein